MATTNPMLRLIFYGLLSLSCYSQTFGQKKLNENPNKAKLVTTDIVNFWYAYDSAQEKSTEEQEQIFQALYLDKASVGFQSWIDKRDKKVAELVKGINTLTPFYESIRPNTLRVEEYEKDIRAGFYALNYLYPEAAFPDVYFFIWYFLSSGSTTSDEGLLIATETHSIAEDTPLDAFPEVHHKTIRSFTLEGMAALAAHESVHMQQPDWETTNLLEKSVREGSADFIAELATGRNPSQPVHDYANPQEEKLWNKFREAMYSSETGDWMGVIPNDKPPGLGYWMGYKMVEAFYEKQTNKRKAVQRLITTTDYEAIYEESGYGEKFGR